METPEDFLYWRSENKNHVHAQEPSRFPWRVFPAVFVRKRVPVRIGQMTGKLAGEVLNFQCGGAVSLKQDLQDFRDLQDCGTCPKSHDYKQEGGGGESVKNSRKFAFSMVSCRLGIFNFSKNSYRCYQHG